MKRGRCSRRLVPAWFRFAYGLYRPQKPSLCRVAVFSFRLDNAGRMDIIGDRRGRCSRRLTPFCERFIWAESVHKNRHLAEWRFLFLSFCIRIETEWPRIWNVTTKYIASPPFGVVTNRPPMYAASLCCIIYGGRFFVKFSCQGASFPPRGTIRTGGAVYSTRRIRSRQRRCSALVVRM